MFFVVVESQKVGFPIVHAGKNIVVFHVEKVSVEVVVDVVVDVEGSVAVGVVECWSCFL